MPDESCKKCYYFDESTDRNGKSKNEGICRRHAPKPRTPEHMMMESRRDDCCERPPIWPLVMADDWCGEFKAKD